MALEDVVQGVQVNVKTDGVDDAKSKIGQLDKAVGDLAKTAESASGGGRSGGGGVGGLSKALSDLSATGAQAFANIARSAASGDIVGLATLLGGRFTGSIVQAGEALGQFTLTQDNAALRNAAMAKEFGTTPDVMQGIKESFEGAGISAGGFERLVNRMSRQVVNDYSSMMSSLRTDTDTQEKAAIRLQAAQENLEKTLDDGSDPKRFEEMDKIRAEKMGQIAIDDAIEAQRQTALKSIPHVTELLRQSSRAGKENTDLMEVSVGTLRKSIEYMAGSAPGHIAKGVDVLKQEFDLIKSGAIDADKAYELLSSQMGSRMSAGIGGMDTEQVIQYAKTHGAAGITAAQAGQSEITKAGLGQTPEDTARAADTIASWSKLIGVLGAIFQKIGTAITPAATSGLDGLTKGLESIVEQIQGASKIRAAVNAQPGSDWGIGALFTSIGDGLSKLGDDANNFNTKLGEGLRHYMSMIPGIGGAFVPGAPLPIPPGPQSPLPGTQVPLPGTPIPFGGGVTVEFSGGAKIYHIPEHLSEPPAGIEYTSGTAKIIHIAPDDIKELKTSPSGSFPPVSYNPNDPRYQHMSVSDDANAPWRQLRGAPGPEPITAPAAPAVPPQPASGTFTDILNGFKSAFSENSGGTAPLPDRATPDQIRRWGAAPLPDRATPDQIQRWGSGAPPAITVNPASPAITVNVTAPVSVSVSRAATTATPGTGTASVAAGHADGGLISIPGFADGGMIQSFADGGMSQGIPNAWPQDISNSPWSTQAILKAISGFKTKDARDFLTSHVTGSWTEEGAMSALELAGIQASRAAVGTTLGVISNPFGTGVLDPTQVGAADRSAGAGAAEAVGRAMGAHNLKEAAELGIPGFAMGSIRGPGNGTSDSILARLSNGEFVMKDAAVRTYGEGFMHAINNMQIPPPKYAGGGMIPTSSLPHFSEGGSMERPGSILNLHVGGEVFSGLKAPAAVADQLRKFAIGQQTSQTGRKPSWAGG